jgi:four helix bundle protein
VKIRSFRELTVWQRAHQLVLKVFRLTEKFPRSDQFGIVAQVRRSSSSVAANLAEGFGRGTTRELLRSLQIARGELEETRYFMLLGGDLGCITKEEFEDLNLHCDSVGQLINALGRSLRGKLMEGSSSRVTNHKLQVTL